MLLQFSLGWTENFSARLFLFIYWNEIHRLQRPYFVREIKYLNTFLEMYLTNKNRLNISLTLTDFINLLLCSLSLTKDSFDHNCDHY